MALEVQGIIVIDNNKNANVNVATSNSLVISGINVSSYATSSYNQANTLITQAQAAFDKANTGSGSSITIQNISANTSANVQTHYIANTINGSFTITLPSSPSLNDTITISDGYNFSSNALTINGNGNTFRNSANNLLIDLESVKVTLTYDGTTWMVSDTKQFGNWPVLPGTYNIDYIVVGGGGAGGGQRGGGGGGGGVITGNTTISPGNTIIISVGAGGQYSSGLYNGQNSSFIVTNTSNTLLSGITKTTYSGYMNDNPAFFDTATPTTVGVNPDHSIQTSRIQVPNTGGGDNFSCQWLGYWCPQTSGTYTFYLDSDDCSYMWIGTNAYIGYTTSNALINNGGTHGVTERSASINLVAGVYYPIRIQFGQGGGGYQLDFYYSTSTVSKTTDVTGLVFCQSGGFFDISLSVAAAGGGAGSPFGSGGNINGASGGGARSSDNSTGTGGTGISGQGYAGGSALGGNGGAGGGGAGGVGQNKASNTNVGGNGGNGLQWLDGNYYGGGGGGGSGQTGDGRQGTTGNISGYGGLGGGGNGNYYGSPSGGAGVPNTGGGGGGNSDYGYVGGPGGSGIVIIRYAGIPRASGGNITIANGYTYHTFTDSAGKFIT